MRRLHYLCRGRAVSPLCDAVHLTEPFQQLLLLLRIHRFSTLVTCDSPNIGLRNITLLQYFLHSGHSLSLPRIIPTKPCHERDQELLSSSLKKVGKNEPEIDETCKRTLQMIVGPIQKHRRKTNGKTRRNHNPDQSRVQAKKGTRATKISRNGDEERNCNTQNETTLKNIFSSFFSHSVIRSKEREKERERESYTLSCLKKVK